MHIYLSIGLKFYSFFLSTPPPQYYSKFPAKVYSWKCFSLSVTSFDARINENDEWQEWRIDEWVIMTNSRMTNTRMLFLNSSFVIRHSCHSSISCSFVYFIWLSWITSLSGMTNIIRLLMKVHFKSHAPGNRGFFIFMRVLCNYLSKWCLKMV
jgi:hypothetical protein